MGDKRIGRYRQMGVPCAAVVFDYFFTLANPYVTSERELAPFVTRVLPGLTSAKFRDRVAAASVINPAAEGSAAAFDSYWTRWVRHGEALFRTLGVCGAGADFAAARYRAHATAAAVRRRCGHDPPAPIGGTSHRYRIQR